MAANQPRWRFFDVASAIPVNFLRVEYHSTSAGGRTRRTRGPRVKTTRTTIVKTAENFFRPGENPVARTSLFSRFAWVTYGCVHTIRAVNSIGSCQSVNASRRSDFAYNAVTGETPAKSYCFQTEYITQHNAPVVSVSSPLGNAAFRQPLVYSRPVADFLTCDPLRPVRRLRFIMFRLALLRLKNKKKKMLNSIQYHISRSHSATSYAIFSRVLSSFFFTRQRNNAYTFRTFL